MNAPRTSLADAIKNEEGAIHENRMLRAENQRLREELGRAAGWMERAALKEKGAAMTSGYLIRIAAARTLAPKEPQ